MIVIAPILAIFLQPCGNGDWIDHIRMHFAPTDLNAEALDFSHPLWHLVDCKLEDGLVIEPTLLPRYCRLTRIAARSPEAFSLETNRLPSYGPEQLQKEMQHHRYDVQARIYFQAMRKWLAASIADFDPSTDLGGAYYLFVRGMKPETQNGILFLRPEELNV